MSGLRTRAARSPPDRQREFIEWARGHLAPLRTITPADDATDLDCLGEMIGDATLVAFTEAVHGAAEPLEFRNRLLRYLVREKGFTAIAVESGLVESRVVHDYVRGGRAEAADVIAKGLSWTFDQLPQNRALIEWLRHHNASPGRRPVNFYGFDVVPAGTTRNPANRTLETSLDTALTFLQRADVDPAASAALRARFEPLLQSMRNSPHHAGHISGYERLGQVERDALSAAIANLVASLERQQARYTQASSAREYAWIHRSAMAARQTDAWLRHMPVGWAPFGPSEAYPDPRSFLSLARDVRDRAQADNIEWIVHQEGPMGKVLVFGHRYHLSAAPIRENYRFPNGEVCRHAVAGTYLRSRFGDRLCVIGNVIGHGQIACGDVRQTLEPAADDSLDGMAAAVGARSYALDLRAAPEPPRLWLEQEHPLAHAAQGLMLAPREAFDLLFYVDEVGPACA